MKQVEFIRGDCKLHSRHRGCVEAFGGFDGQRLGHRAVAGEADERTAAALSLIENVRREDPGALQQLVIKFDLGHHEIADIIGRSRPSVTNLIRLLDLSSDARALLEDGSLEMGHGRVLLRLPRDRQGPRRSRGK